MVRAPCFDKNGIKKGAWSTEEDNKLRSYIQIHGHSNWRELPKLAGLSRCGKSCRLRWMNYLRPNMKRGKFSKQEEDVIVGLHKKLGNKWSMMTAQLPGRSDNEIKNHWHTHLKNRNEKDQSVSIKPNKQVIGSVDQSVSKANFIAGGDCQQVKEPNLKSQPEVEILLAVLSSELPAASASASASSSSSSSSSSGDQLSECSLSVSDYEVPCDEYVTPQFLEMGENLWFEEFLDNSLNSNTNFLQDQIMDDVHLWSNMDLYE